MSSTTGSRTLVEGETGVVNRRRTENAIGNRHEGDALEENLLSTIDRFLETLEQKLDLFEQYFTRTKTGTSYVKEAIDNKPKTDGKGHVNEADLQKFYELLKLMKASLLESTSSKLETISSFFNENYTALFSSVSHNHSGSFIRNSSTALHDQIMLGLEHLEVKLNQADQLIGNFQPKFNIDYLNYYNYELALSQGSHKNLHYYQLPFLWRENRFIIHGYRFYSKKRTLLKSIFAYPFHNESANIWTHLLGSLLITFLTFYHFPTTPAYHRNVAASGFFDNVFVYLFLFASFNCLVCSTFWHTFTGTANLPFRNRCVCLDYTGITVLISASIISVQYCSLYYFPILQKFFMSVTCTLSLLGFYLNWSPRFDRPESRPLRVLFFVLLATSGITCFITLCLYKGFSHSFRYFAPLLVSFGSYITGVVFYSLLIPERWRTDVILDEALPDTNCMYETISEEINKSKGTPDLCSCDNLIDKHFLENHFKTEPSKTLNYGKFMSLWWVDYVCSSHTIWHFFVLCGILGHYWGVLQMFAQIEVNKP